MWRFVLANCLPSSRPGEGEPVAVCIQLASDVHPDSDDALVAAICRKYATADDGDTTKARRTNCDGSGQHTRTLDWSKFGKWDSPWTPKIW